MPLREVTRIAEDDIKDRLQKLPGVGAIDVVDGSEREIQVWVDRDGLAAYGLTVSDLAGALQAQNLEVPGGRMLMDGREFAVKTKGEVDSVAALGDIIITGVGGAPVRVRDVARVEDGSAEERSASDLDGARAVALVIRKQSGANTVAVAQRVKGELETIKSELPAGMSLIVPSDNSVFIEASTHDVQFDLMAGAILTVLIIMLFLRDWRATLISAIALPTSVIATFGFMEVMGFTFNNMTMLALTLSIGILIDDAIVVIENIYRHREAGKSPTQAAMEGSGEIGPAVVAMTLANLAVFLPVATMKGIVGRFFFQFGLTVSFAIAVSMFVSFTLTPMLASKYLSKYSPTSSERRNPGRLSSLIGSGLSRLEAVYTRVLGVALRHPLGTVGIAALVFAGSFGSMFGCASRMRCAAVRTTCRGSGCAAHPDNWSNSVISSTSKHAQARRKSSVRIGNVRSRCSRTSRASPSETP